jgi:subtilisin family serine protease
MQGPFLGTKSASARLAVAFSFLIVLTLFIVAALPPTSNATLQGNQSDVKPKQTRAEFVPGEALVRYRSERAASRHTRQAMLNAAGRQLFVQVDRFDGSDIVPGLRLARVAAEDTLAAIEALKQQPDVLYAEPNYVLYLDATPNDPRFLSNELFGLAKIGAPAAWDVIKGSSDTPQAGFGNPRIVVGVIDEGVDVSHPDLFANVWVNSTEIPNNSVDDDGNGFIDDINGYDFALNTGTITAQFHGTHVAGTIGAVGNNATGVVGVNWGVGLMSLKFITGLRADTADAIRACNYAKQMRDLWVSTAGTRGANLRVLNNSYGSLAFTQSFLDAINAVNQSGILFVASAGNAEGFTPEPNNDLIPHYPSSYSAPGVIAVASTGQTDNLASDSHFGLSSVHLGAPGVAILSTTPGNTYSFSSGTSMAAPHVAGAAALLLARDPNLTINQLKSLLIYNGDLVPSLAGKTLTGRRLNVGNSLLALAENDVTPPGTVTSFNLNSQNGRALNVGWTASGDDGAVGQASLYQLAFTDATSGAVIFLKSVIPAASGVTQAIDVKLPYRHTNGTLTMREFDNVGNEGVPATVAVSVSPVEGDPYLTSTGSAVALSPGGVGLATNCDDCFKIQALPFSFPFFGENFNSVEASTNGSLYFGPHLANDSGSSAVALSQFKMIAGLWDDLRTDTRPGDDIFVETPDANRIIFRWKGVTFNDNPALQFPVNFEIELRSNGTILTRYGDGNTNVKPVVGISGGEPDVYLINSHTAEQAETNLTNAAEVTFLPRAIGITSSVQFSAPQFQVVEFDGAATVRVSRVGDTTTQSSVDYVTTDGAAKQKGDFTFGSGTINFAAGETSKSFSVLIVDDVFVEGTESFSVLLSNPVNTALGARNVAEVRIFDNDGTPPTTNPLDNADARFFVRQHYLDFLSREPDAGGLAFWAGQITACGSDQACVEDRRINVSAAFFLSIEFQETGYLAYRMYKASYGNLLPNPPVPPNAPVPVRYEEFLPDTQQIALGVMVGIGDWETLLENNKQAFAAKFVARSRFTTAYPLNTEPAVFVDALYTNAGVTPSASERTLVIGEFGAGATTTGDTAARARVIRRVAENAALKQQELNRAFVLMQYFGYLRRNPYDPPELTLDYAGYNFWLNKLNEFNGNFIAAQMVKAFIDSDEYRRRFGP